MGLNKSTLKALAMGAAGTALAMKITPVRNFILGEPWV